MFHRERCLLWAERAPTDRMRGTFLNLTKLYEIELGLCDRSAMCVTDRRELLITVDNRLHSKSRPAARALSIDR